MIIYLNTIISFYIDEAILKMIQSMNNQCIRLSVPRYKSDFKWLESINYNSSTIALLSRYIVSAIMQCVSNIFMGKIDNVDLILIV